MLRNLKNIAVVSLSTVGSRVLGLVRDVLVFAALGAGLWNSAFILAFTLPNLFRRLLGEGALTSAVVPVFSDVMERDGRAAAFGFFNHVLLRLVLVLVALVAGGVALLGVAARRGVLSERWELAAGLAALLLPYMLFICVAAILCAGLNLLGRFAVASTTPVLLNVAMIAAIGCGLLLESEPAALVRWLCAGVLVGGLLQLLAPAWDLSRQGWRPCVEKTPSKDLVELWRLFLPGLLGAAVLQLNVLVSRVLAYALDESAASILYLAGRLMELPLGVFTIAVTTVFFPVLVRAMSRRDEAAFADAFAQGMRLVIGISVPAGVGLLVLGGPILDTLFRWGAFEASDVAATVPLLGIYGVGLPFYSAATFATRGLHAAKDMRTPVRVAALCLAVNAVSGLSLMLLIGAAGLATANVIAAIVQAVLLWRMLSREHKGVDAGRLVRACRQTALAAALMGALCVAGRIGLHALPLDAKTASAATVVLMVPLGALFYLGALKRMGFEEMGALSGLLKRPPGR